ncbi:GntR family transcriptional regulator [Actinophytocola sp.]|uniref:GntR family transcriptional regulator n=1 Tax=Actinophytocola sp. TaxID=1872138 RepID=UPI003D6A8A7A
MDVNSNRARGRNSVHRAFLGSQIADVLRRDILLGRIKPGTRLAQQQLCEQFGTSRMPVRDGLRALSHEGLLTVDSGQHTVVAPLSKADLADSFLVEGMLTGLAARRASERASDAELDELDELHRKMIAAAKSRDQSAMAGLNWSLHRQINRLSGSRKLLAAIRAVSLDVPQDFLVQVPDWSIKSNREHYQILLAMREGRHDDVERLMLEHVVASGNGLIAYLESQGLKLE